MKEYCVLYVRGGEEYQVVLPSWWKLLWWFIRTARRCGNITIFTLEK